jgi:hypothetical protein
MSLCRFIKRYSFVVTYLVKVLCRYPIKSSDEREKVATNRLTFINNNTSIEKHRRRNTTIVNSNTIDRLTGIFGGLLNCISPQRFPENARLFLLPSNSIAARYVHDPVSPSTNSGNRAIVCEAFAPFPRGACLLAVAYYWYSIPVT